MTLIERYGTHPDAIERRSFEIVRELVPDLDGMEDEQIVKVRMVHASGDPSIVPHMRFHPQAVAAGVAALQAGATIHTDVRMIAVGISTYHTERLGVNINCLMDHPEMIPRARAEGTTRAVAAVRLAGASLGGSIVAVGNAPTALLALLDLVDAGVCRPALVVGIPVGFVNAAESKDELLLRDIPYVTLLGNRGGSTLAVSILNALLRVATGLHRYGF